MEKPGRRVRIFSAVARVSDNSWTACAVLDTLGFGLKVGGELDLTSTLCHEIRGSHQTIVIDKASEDELYCNHPAAADQSAQAQLFQPFSHPLNDTVQSGLGLGLYIANQIALAHGGRMEVISSQEAGTLFSFRLPLGPDEVRATLPANP